MKLARLLLFTLLVFAACGGTTKGWTRPQTTTQQFETDSYRCSHEARQSVWKFGRALPRESSTEKQTVNKDLYRSCMRANGYQLVDGEEWEGFRD